MSYGDSSAFTSNNEFDRSFDTSYGPSQSTQATDVSDYSNTGVADRQVREHLRSFGYTDHYPFQSLYLEARHLPVFNPPICGFFKC